MYVSTLFGKRGRDVSNNLVFISEFLFGKQATSFGGRDYGVYAQNYSHSVFYYMAGYKLLFDMVGKVCI